ncbi:PF11871 domain protein [Leptospira inadai serovar Lyme str. 10]|uniref:PF11871 domain protein n=2 Tax=Leptospira inadai serovar Lyme TaxID=293084 RepID=V6HCV5_9LEPT|nr:HD-GYP domain-containing protein [Leptospira inadai]EQA37552.1 PF11871 domain protein [Leptospira inadai serovar Lyme str. 10]PNV76305.1 HD domain-containing protein [Leptospira inadai serovar Lyme]
MKKVSVAELKPGMRFSKPVYLDKENLFITSNTPITDSDLERLKRFGITEVLTHGDPLQLITDPDFLETQIEDIIVSTIVDEDLLPLKGIYDNLNRIKIQFSSLYKSTFNVVQDVYRKAAEDKNFEFGPIRDQAESLSDFVRLHSNLSYLILGMNNPGYYLYNQITNSTFYALIIGKLLDYSRPKMVDLAISCLVADVGMTKVPATVSEKTDQLNDEEYKSILKHTIIGYQILTQRIKMKNNLAVVALQHHERYDGKGYPQKLAATAIEEAARIYAIADNFSALITNRPHRKRILPHEAIKSMISMDVGKFDLKIVRTFLNHVSLYPVGSCVELSDKRVGLVLSSNPDKPLRPSIRIVKDEYGTFVRNLILVDLVKENHLFIVKALDLQEATNAH